MEDEIKGIIVLEIMGKPAGYIVKTLNKIIDKIGEDAKIAKREVHKAKKIENSELFSTFAEIEIESSVHSFLKILFTYMPSHVEIMYPEKLSMSSSNINMVFNEITMRLHQYDEIAKRVISERNILEEQVRRLGQKPITQHIREKEEEERRKKTCSVQRSAETEKKSKVKVKKKKAKKKKK